MSPAAVRVCVWRLRPGMLDDGPGECVDATVGSGSSRSPARNAMRSVNSVLAVPHEFPAETRVLTGRGMGDGQTDGYGERHDGSGSFYGRPQ